jgi:hypothetical protein
MENRNDPMNRCFLRKHRPTCYRNETSARMWPRDGWRQEDTKVQRAPAGGANNKIDKYSSRFEWSRKHHWRREMMLMNNCSDEGKQLFCPVCLTIPILSAMSTMLGLSYLPMPLLVSRGNTKYVISGYLLLIAWFRCNARKRLRKDFVNNLK